MNGPRLGTALTLMLVAIACSSEARRRPAGATGPLPKTIQNGDV